MNNKLLPCRWCYTQHSETEAFKPHYSSVWQVRCGQCLSTSPVSLTKEGAIKIWNSDDHEPDSTQLKHPATDNSTQPYTGDCKIYTGTEWIPAFLGTNLDHALSIKVMHERIGRLEEALKKIESFNDSIGSIAGGYYTDHGIAEKRDGFIYQVKKIAKEALEGK